MNPVGSSRDTKEAGACRRTIMLIDASNLPGSNDRSRKLGFGNQTFASAIMAYDQKRKLIASGDGTESELVRYPFEPDNWIYRKHAKGFDTVWAVRLIVDKTNKANELKNRSTHVLDQDEHQNYGNFADLFWICKTEAQTDFSVNGGGYASAGNGTRDALALSCAENEGFISDGDKFGQLAHVFTFLEPEAPTKGGGGKKPDTPTVPGGGNATVPTVGNSGGTLGGPATPGHGSTTGGLDEEGNVVGGINEPTGSTGISTLPAGWSPRDPRDPGHIFPPGIVPGGGNINDPNSTGDYRNAK